MNWEIVIGLETHVQLSTVSKIFSGTSTVFGAAPNAQASAIDLALPGVLPALNRGAVERAICFGLAIGAKVAPYSVFARKNYFYPDLPKGYQISQFDQPIVEHGTLTIQIPQAASGNKNQPQDVEKTIRILRAHLEEDAGKLLHEEFAGLSGVDLNRAGVPLLEIVTEPDMRSATEAVAYAKALHTLVVWLGICDGNMQEGSFRCDANVSVRPVGQEKLGTRAEIKNLNSFRFLEEAIRYEAQRQIELIESGGSVIQETRLYDPTRRETRSMRSKEDAQDYRYFSDPDLLPLVVSAEWIEQVRSTLPELPAAMCERFIKTYELSAYDAHQLTASKALADYYETAVEKTGAQHAKVLANWITGELAAQLKRHELSIEACPVTPAQLARLLMHIVNGAISNKIAKEVFQTMWDEKSGDEAAADRIIEAQGLQQISEVGELEAIIDQVLAANTKSVEEFRAGKQKAFNALVGQVMKATQGKANPQQVNACMQQKLGEKETTEALK